MARYSSSYIESPRCFIQLKKIATVSEGRSDAVETSQYAWVNVARPTIIFNELTKEFGRPRAGIFSTTRAWDCRRSIDEGFDGLHATNEKTRHARFPNFTCHVDRRSRA